MSTDNCIAASHTGLKPLYRKGSGRIVQFTDVHLALKYKGTPENNYLDKVEPDVKYGLDPGVELLEAALECAKKVIPKPNFFLYNGDSVIHEGKHENEKKEKLHFPRTYKYHNKVIGAVMSRLRKTYPNLDKSRFFALAVGNMETIPDYAMDVTDGQEINPTLSEIKQGFENVLLEGEEQDFVRRGYSRRQIEDGLWMITLNTAVYHPRRSGDSKNGNLEDPLGQFAWLRKTLRSIEQERENSLICGHVPPVLALADGVQQWEKEYIETYKKIITDFAGTIKAQLFGHTHDHEIRDYKVPLYISGPISPLHKVNPSFTVWEYDKKTFEILDSHVYGTLDLKNWGYRFSAVKSYGLTDLRKGSLVKLRNYFVDEGNFNQEQFNHFHLQRYVYRGYNLDNKDNLVAPANVKKCDHVACLAAIRCAFKKWYSDIVELQECHIKERAHFASKGFRIEEDMRIFKETAKEVARREKKLTRKYTSTARILYPSNETGLKEEPTYNPLSTCATVFMMVIVLAVIVLVLDKVFGIKSRWTRLVKGMQTENRRQ